MARRISSFAVPASLVGAFVSAAYGGPGCVEGVTDAGSARPTATTCYGSGALPVVSGTLSSVRDGQGADFEDMFLIRITDPAGFSARTDGLGFADFDTQLWLLRPVGVSDAFGLLGNDEILGGPVERSRLLPPATDGTGQTIPGAGLYLLAISGFNNDPTSSGGLIFNQALRTEVSGPDGPGGGLSHGSWTGVGATGTYSIRLTGAEYVPFPPSGANVPAITPLGGFAMSVFLVAAGLVVFKRIRSSQEHSSRSTTWYG